MNKSFELGQMVITSNASSILSNEDIQKAIARHSNCDWGDLEEEDREVNNQALKDGDRLFSAYHDSNNVKFWIITEADRSVTTVLMPEDY